VNLRLDHYRFNGQLFGCLEGLSAECATIPRGTGTLNFFSNSFAWYSCIFIAFRYAARIMALSFCKFELAERKSVLRAKPLASN
jgi:hypothetical protein